jgi:nucleoside-diphosphate-sugar epimerase
MGNRASNQPGQVLLVGGAGYIGSVLTRRLLALGLRVRCFDALLYGNGSAIAPLFEDPNFSFVRGDLRRPDEVRGALEGVTHVVLLASLVGDPVCRAHPDMARAINLTASKEFVAALEPAGVSRLVFLSTCSNYGVAAEIAHEGSRLDPRSLYAETKVAMEEHLLAGAAGGCTTTILRGATAFGLSPRMRFDLTASEFTRELALGRELEVYDAGTWRPYCHVYDISEAIIRVLDADPAAVAGQVFNVGDDAMNYTKAMIVDLLRTIVTEPRIVIGRHSADVRDYRVSFAKIRQALGFTSSHTMRDACVAVARAVRGGVYDDVEARPAFYHNRL